MKKINWDNFRSDFCRNYYGEITRWNKLVKNPYEIYGEQFEEYKKDKFRHIFYFLELGIDADPFGYIVCNEHWIKELSKEEMDIIFVEYLKCESLEEWCEYLDKMKSVRFIRK